METNYREFEKAIYFAANNKIKIELEDNQKHIEESINYYLDYRYKLANAYLDSDKNENIYNETIEMFSRINSELINILGLKTF